MFRFLLQKEKQKVSKKTIVLELVPNSIQYLQCNETKYLESSFISTEVHGNRAEYLKPRTVVVL